MEVRHFIAQSSGTLPEPETDRRASHRFRTVYRIAAVAREGDIGLWRVRNISDRGMMLSTKAHLLPGEPLRIALSERIVLSAKVMWCADGRWGVALDEPVDSRALLQRLADARRDRAYRAPRLPVSAPALATGEHGMTAVRLVNLSQYGAAFAHAHRFRPGMGLKLLLEDGLERRGVVRWARDGRAGMALTEPIAATDLESTRRFGN